MKASVVRTHSESSRDQELSIGGECGGKSRRWRPRDGYAKQSQNDVGCSSYSEMKRLAQNRVAWTAASNQSSD